MTGAGVWTPRANLRNGFVLFTEIAAVRRELTWWNAECNIRDLDRMFPKQADMLRLCQRLGIEPLSELPPHEGPGYPPINTAMVHVAWPGGSAVQPHHDWRDYEGQPCEHRWIVPQWSGYDCNDCGRHFGMYD
ncbi:hypothetical protein [Mycolicibacterium sphagni]|uniref:hypothetical protein n=1 Tax=Mycolicibacterium sphagni TaxID=1786 RepID=UPI0021F274B6|nr:hypothetical protein [Mycolicibacterium sphagni]MCV7174858.1 hypothetical protein [Mycolicibacterium sphagni]